MYIFPGSAIISKDGPYQVFFCVIQFEIRDSLLIENK